MRQLLSVVQAKNLWRYPWFLSPLPSNPLVNPLKYIPNPTTSDYQAVIISHLKYFIHLLIRLSTFSLTSSSVGSGALPRFLNQNQSYQSLAARFVGCWQLISEPLTSNCFQLKGSSLTESYTSATKVAYEIWSSCCNLEQVWKVV